MFKLYKKGGTHCPEAFCQENVVRDRNMPQIAPEKVEKSKVFKFCKIWKFLCVRSSQIFQNERMSCAVAFEVNIAAFSFKTSKELLLGRLFTSICNLCVLFEMSE